MSWLWSFWRRRDDKRQGIDGAANDDEGTGTLLPKYDLNTPPPPRATWIALDATIGAAGLLLCLRVYKRHLRRIPNAAYIKPDLLRKKVLYGKVTSVGDGDGFRFYHTPGGRLLGWGWIRRIPTEGQLRGKDQTISVRIAGVDAPERPHFGKPAQPHSEESYQWLRRKLLGKYVKVQLLEHDRYKRIVGSASLWWLLGRRDLGLDMLRAGMATVYEANTGVVFPPGLEEKYRDAEEKARRRRLGLWKGLEETPRQFKQRTAKAE